MATDGVSPGATEDTSSGKPKNEEQRKIAVAGLRSTLRDCVFGKDWDPSNPELNVIVQVLAALALDLAAARRLDGKSGLPDGYGPFLLAFTDRSTLEKNDIDAARKKILAKLNSVELDPSRKLKLTRWLNGNQRPLDAAPAVPSELSARLRDAVNGMVEKRAAAFDKLGAAYSQELAMVRRGLATLPKVTVAREIVSRQGVCDLLHEMYGRPTGEVAAWLDGRDAPQYGLEHVFSEGGTGMNDPVALVQVAAASGPTREWWKEDELVCWSMDWHKLDVVYDYYREWIVTGSSTNESCGFPRRPLVPGANAVIFAWPDKGRNGVLLQRRPAGSMGGGNRARLSLFGGAYQAHFLKAPHDQGSLKRTLDRELIEEAGIVPGFHTERYFVALEEVKMKSQIQYCALGLVVDNFDDAFIEALSQRGNPEGGAEVLGAEALADLITKRSWELSCHAFAALAVWILCGAPGAEPAYKLILDERFKGEWWNRIDFELQVADARKSGGRRLALILGQGG